MKNLLLILLLANILYFLWGLFNEREELPGVAVIDEAALGPSLAVSSAPAADVVADDETALDEVLVQDEETAQGDGTGPDDEPALAEAPEPIELAAVIGRSCITIGPFRIGADAESAQTQIIGDGMRAKLRSVQGQIFVGHWVQIRNVADRNDGNTMLARLRDGDITDAYIVETEDEGMKISLGLFGDIEGAERIELQAESLGFDAEISPRMSEGTLFFVDVELPPGRGAGAVIEHYGEDRVKLRDEASCPELR